MKILYISLGDHSDYQDDCLSIGLKQLFGPDVVDVNKREHIYKSFPADKANRMYGKGMTLTRIVEDYPIERDAIEEKIKKRYFDLIVYGSIARCAFYLPLVLEHYSRSRIFVVDGEDQNDIFKTPIQLGLPYFKRELNIDIPGVFPINFAIPQEKISIVKNKIRDFAVCDPRDKNSYVYSTEKEYYSGYNDARMAITVKKAGWDCMRHYEIIGNGCLPLFLDIADCPKFTMTTLRKDLFLEILKEYYSRVSPTVIYAKYQENFFKEFLINCTTLSLAKKIIDKFNSLN